jgi:hypothetical protein
MVFTFAGSLSAAEAGRAEIRMLLIVALGCNLARGIVDAVMYLVGCMVEKGWNLKINQAVRKVSGPGEYRGFSRTRCPPPMVASALDAKDLEMLRLRLLKLPEAPAANCPC